MKWRHQTVTGACYGAGMLASYLSPPPSPSRAVDLDIRRHFPGLSVYLPGEAVIVHPFAARGHRLCAELDHSVVMPFVVMPSRLMREEPELAAELLDRRIREHLFAEARGQWQAPRQEEYALPHLVADYTAHPRRFCRALIDEAARDPLTRPQTNEAEGYDKQVVLDTLLGLPAWIGRTAGVAGVSLLVGDPYMAEKTAYGGSAHAIHPRDSNGWSHGNGVVWIAGRSAAEKEVVREELLHELDAYLLRELSSRFTSTHAWKTAQAREEALGECPVSGQARKAAIRGEMREMYGQWGKRNPFYTQSSPFREIELLPDLIALDAHLRARDGAEAADARMHELFPHSWMLLAGPRQAGQELVMQADGRTEAQPKESDGPGYTILSFLEELARDYRKRTGLPLTISHRPARETLPGIAQKRDLAL